MATVPFEFNGVVRLTSIGAAHVLLTLVLGFAAINTGNNSLYLALAFLLGSLLVSGIASKGGLRHVRVEVVHLNEGWAGQPLSALLRVSNQSAIWSVRDIVIVAPELQESLMVEELPRRASRDIPAQFFFARRGRVSLTFVDLYTRYPFGFFLKKRRRRISGEAIIYPRLLPEAEVRTGLAPDLGESRASNRSGAGTDIFGFRDYVRGDSLRHVHWRKSASLGRWIMKQPELEWVPSITVVVDPVKPEWASEEQFEQMVSAAATFLHQAMESRQAVTLRLPQLVVHGDGEVGRRSVFEALALLAPVQPRHAPALLHEPGEIVFSLRTGDESQAA